MKKALTGKLLPIILLVLLVVGGCQKENPTTAPTITTSALKNITALSATCGGTITSVGGEQIKEQGVCLSTSANPTVSDLKITDDSGSRNFTVSVIGLSEVTTYHVRAYATNAVGVGYGDDISFTTAAIPLPTVTTTAISALSYTTLTTGGVIVTDGGSPITAKGVCWSTLENPTTADLKTSDGTGIENYVSNVTGLTPSTAYHLRAYATSSKGTAYGDDIPFTTLTIPTGIPSLTTVAGTSVTTTTAVSGGGILSDGGVAITAKGVCWSTTADPTIDGSKTTDGSGADSFVSNITNLAAATTYHVRAYATNALGTAYGNDIKFATTKVTSTAAEEFLLGNPSNATTNAASPDYFSNYFLSKPQYCLSFNNTTHNTNWTSWHLFAGDLGSAGRSSTFSADPDLPAGFYAVGNWDYNHTLYGFERGHMCPSADRTSTPENNLSTFVMSNAIPQAPNCNSPTWSGLEDYCRTLVGQGNELYIICGPYGKGGISAVGYSEFVNGDGGVNIDVPAQVWKIVVVIPNGNNDIDRIDNNTRVIAVKMPNTQACSAQNWKYYRTSVDDIEALTGYNFLSNVPDAIESVIEAKVDAVP